MHDPSDPPLGFATLPEPLRARIEAELAPGERLLWAAQPGPKRSNEAVRSRWVGWVRAGGSAAVAVTSFFGSIHLIKTLELFFELLAVVLMFVAVVAGVFAFFSLIQVLEQNDSSEVERLHSPRGAYALTDRRALIWLPVADSEAMGLNQYPPGSIKPAEMRRIEYADGSGDLLFQSHQGGPGFLGVAEVHHVDELVRDVLMIPRLTRAETSFAPDETEEPF